MKQQLTVELIGLPNSGKSITAQALIRILTENEIPSLWIQETALTSPLVPGLSGSFDFNVWSSNAMVNRLIEAKQNKEIRVVLAERAIYDHIALFQALISTGKVERAKAKEKVHSLERDGEDYIDLVILIEISPQASLERDQGGEEVPYGPVTNFDFLQHLAKAYQRLKLPSAKLKLIKAEGMGHDEIRKKALRIICKKLKINQKDLRIIPRSSQNGFLAEKGNTTTKEKGGPLFQKTSSHNSRMQPLSC